jgi:short-subunit dehydrogenase
VNLMGVVNVVRAGYAAMVPRESGHLVAIASLAGLLPTPLLVPYATAKGGVVSFMTSLRPEAARRGIGASTVCPGPVDTVFLDRGGEHGHVARVDVRRYLTSAAGPAIAPAAVANAVIKAVERNRAVVTPGRARALHVAARLAPATTERVISRAMSRELGPR